jgi:hypothetical protein
MEKSTMIVKQSNPLRKAQCKDAKEAMNLWRNTLIWCKKYYNSSANANINEARRTCRSEPSNEITQSMQPCKGKFMQKFSFVAKKQKNVRYRHLCFSA